MPRPVCVACKREMTLVRAVPVQFNALAVAGAYEQWMGDLARCEGCGAEVVARWAEQPYWRHHHGGQVGESPSIVIEERRSGAGAAT